MAPLQVIGAGFGRTGTDSLRTALNMLGYNTHHMRAMFDDPQTNPDDFTEAFLHEDQADWDKIYENYDAAVDWPTAAFYKQLLKKYPDAKVLLTVRSADSWYKSVKNTIANSASQVGEVPEESRMGRFKRMVNTVILDGCIADPEKFKDEDKLKKLFLEHNEEVKRVVPADQLLVMELGEGWERLCNFLGKEVPKEPYPNVNSTKEFRNDQHKAVVEQMLKGNELRVHN